MKSLKRLIDLRHFIDLICIALKRKRPNICFINCNSLKTPISSANFFASMHICRNAISFADDFQTFINVTELDLLSSLFT